MAACLPRRISERAETSLLFAGFFLTGIGTVLLGSILPELSHLWGLSDARAGQLFAAQFTGSALGALLIRPRLYRGLGAGYALFVGGAFALQWVPSPLHVPDFFLLGLGLGLTMTSISMLVGTSSAGHRGRSLLLLNFFWSAGAAVCPILAAAWPLHSSRSTMFPALACVSVLPAMAAWHRPSSPLDPLTTQRSILRTPASVIIFFACMAFLYVGVEASLGGWMATYTMRTLSWKASAATAMASVFWTSLLVGRGAAVLLLKYVRERTLYQLGVAGTLLGMLVLLAAHSLPAIVAGAVLCGVALAPLFPLILAFFMARAEVSPRDGWVFSISGFGGAALAWLTGAISSQTGSLRTGLAVPAVAAALLMVMARGSSATVAKLRAEPSKSMR